MGSSADAKLAWGIDLHATEYGDLHESLADVDDFDEQITAAGQGGVISRESCGYDFEGDLLVIKRTLTWAYDYSVHEVDMESLTPPTAPEIAAMNAVLDHMGYTGPREVKLILVANYG